MPEGSRKIELHYNELTALRSACRVIQRLYAEAIKTGTRSPELSGLRTGGPEVYGRLEAVLDHEIQLVR